MMMQMKRMMMKTATIAILKIATDIDSKILLYLPN